MRRGDKRGQITMFIIIGIVVLFAVGFVLYAMSLIPSLRTVTQKESEFQQYIGTCLESTSQNAVTQLGVRGGYITIPQNIAINERSYFSFGPRTEPKIPLWYYRGEPRVPQISDMEQAISDYVLHNIDACLGNFTTYQDRFIIERNANVSVDTTISDQAVFVKINYPLTVKSRLQGDISKVDPVGRTLSVKLGEMRTMAIDVLRSENEQLFFENATLNLLATNPDFPFTGMEFSCSPKTWRKSQLIDFAQKMVSYNLRQVTVVGNKATFFNSNDLYAKNQFSFALHDTYSDIVAGFQYPLSARFELHVRPNDREVLRSNVGKSGVPLVPLCINQWHFTYDFEYPMLATLRDPTAFDGRGFVFNFAFPVTVNHNQGDKRDFPVTVFESPDADYAFCQDTNDQPVDIRVKDAFTNQEIYHANVSYQCVRLSCDLGQTRPLGGVYRLQAKLPAGCTGGVLHADVSGYLSGEVQYDGSGSADIPVKPLRTMNLNFDVHDSNNYGRTSNLSNGETVTLVLTDPAEPDYEQVYSSDESTANTIDLIDGPAEYSVQAFLIQDGERMTGGYVGTWSPGYSEFADASTVTFHLIRNIPVPVSETEQGDAASYLFDNTSYQQPLRPSFT